MCVWRNNEARSRNHCCCGKAIRSKFCVYARVLVSACVCVLGGGTVARVWFCACSLTYPACNAHVLYCLPPLWLHHIFGQYLINGTIFGKIMNIKCAFWFSLQILFETFLILRRVQRDINIYVNTSSCKVPVIFVGFVDKFSKKKNLKYEIS